jgi:peroxiredoxin Q/BCP
VRYLIIGVVVMSFNLSSLFGGTTPDGSELKEGQLAPVFAALDQNSRSINLSEFKNKSNVVLYFYPKDDTPGCTAQACNLRDNINTIKAMNAVILGVSADDVKSHQEFAEKYQLPFSLLADPKKEIIQKYGVSMPLVGIAKRWTFIIGKDGSIKKIIKDVKSSTHDTQVLEALRLLNP